MTIPQSKLSRINLVVLFLIGAILSGCSAHYGSAQIISDPPGAEVLNDEDGTVIGVTPTTAWWKESSAIRKHVILRFKKDGYYEKVSSFWLSMRHKSQNKAEQNTQKVEVVLQRKNN